VLILCLDVSLCAQRCIEVLDQFRQCKRELLLMHCEIHSSTLWYTVQHTLCSVTMAVVSIDQFDGSISTSCNQYSGAIYSAMMCRAVCASYLLCSTVHVTCALSTAYVPLCSSLAPDLMA
jgi:hypothetical protein